MIFIGDLHSKVNFLEKMIHAYNIKNDNFIQVGDFGAGFIHAHTMRNLNDVLYKRNIMLYVIRGNHDDITWFSGNNNETNIKFLRDYSIINIDNHKIICFGGAISPDRSARTIGYDYWVSEGFSFNPGVLEQARGIDIIAAHNSPNFAFPSGSGQIISNYLPGDPTLRDEIVMERMEVTQAFNILKRNNNIKTYIHGHYHQSNYNVIDGVDFISLGVNEVKEII